MSFDNGSNDDLLPGCTHTIVVEGVSAGKPDGSACDGLRESFVQALTTDFPSMGIAALGRVDCVAKCASYVARGLPLLLVDSRPPPSSGGSGYKSTLDAATTDLMKIERQLVASGTRNCYHACTMASLREVIDNIKRHDLSEEDGKLVKAKHGILQIHEVLKADEDERQAEQLGVDALDDITRAHIDPISEALDVFERLFSYQREVGWKWMLMLFEHTLEGVKKVVSIDEMNAWLRRISCYSHDFCQFFRRECPVLGGKQLSDVIFKKFAKRGDLGFLVQCKGKVGENFCLTIMQIYQGPSEQVSKCANEDQWCSTYEGHKQKLIQTMEEFTGNVRQKVHCAVWNELSDSMNGRHFLGLKAMFESDKLYTGNLHYPRQLKQRIARVAKIDRLPVSNSAAAMRVIRESWDAVDIFTYQAS